MVAEMPGGNSGLGSSLYGYGLPAGTGPAGAASGISAARSAANAGDSSPRSGTSKNSGSPRYAPRSAYASREASRYWYSASARLSPARSKFDRMFSISPMVEPPLDGGDIP